MDLTKTKLWTALITPLTPGLSLDKNSLKSILKEQDNAKNGILILGSTGEALNLSLEMRKEIVDFTLSLNLKSPIMVGVGAHNLAEQIEWTNWLETKSIHAYLMCTPIYAKPGDIGQYEWFKVLMDNVTKPVMLYNVPGRAAKELSFKAVSMLKNHKNFYAIKEASGSVSKMKQYLQACGSKSVYCGDDGLMAEFAEAGACGLVSVAGNTWPKATHEYVNQCLNKNLKEKEMWAKAADTLFIASNPVPAKALMALEGRISHDTMMPPLSRRDLTDLTSLKIASENIQNWLNK